MTLTLEQAIQHCEEVAERQETNANSFENGDDFDKSLITNCLECATEHRQLAEWLRELNEIKHLFSITEKLFRANSNFKGGSIDIVDGYDILFSEHKQLREIFEEATTNDDRQGH